MKRIVCALVAIMMVSCLVGCATKTAVWRPQGSPGFVDMQGKKFLIMPVDLSTLPGDKTKLSAALLASFVGEFGENGISLQPVQPALKTMGFGDLSWRMARGMHCATFVKGTGSWGTCGGVDYSQVATGTKTVVEKVAELLEKPDLKFDYIAVVHVDSMGAATVPKMIKLRVLGGIYDPMQDQIVAAIHWDQTTAEDAVLAEMATIGPRAMGMLAGKKK